MAGDLVVGIGTDDSGLDAAMYAGRLARKAGISVILVFGYEPSSMGPRGGPLEDQVQAIAEEVTSGVKAQLAAQFPDVNVEIELVRDRRTLEPAPAEAKFVVDRMRERGVLVGTDGPFHNVIKIRGPMPLGLGDADRLVETLTRSVGELPRCSPSSASHP